MAGVLTFSQYIGGPDQLVIEQSFPSNQRSVVYNFKQDTSGWNYSADYQTIVVDTVQFNRYTGAPNFSNSRVIGYFPKVDIAPGSGLEPEVINPAEGTVLVTFPTQMYDGPIIPDARKNVPIVVFSFTWNTVGTPIQIYSHRWAFIQAWEPDVELGDPTLEVNYTGISL